MLLQVVQMMGVDNLSSEIVLMQYNDSIVQRGGFTFAVFKELVRDVAMQFRRQEGKYYVLLSLQEAEHLRGIIHGRKNFTLLNSELMAERPTSAAMWVMNDYDMSLLATTSGYQGASASQHAAMVNSFRFMNSDTHYGNVGLTILLRVFEDDTCDNREKWWTEIRSCRRRRQIAIDGTVPLLTVFNTATEFEYMEFKAVVSRVQVGLQEIGMLIYDAFRAFNSSNTGLMSCSELYGGLDYLGIPFTPPQIYDLMKKICVQNEVCALTCVHYSVCHELFRWWVSVSCDWDNIRELACFNCYHQSHHSSPLCCVCFISFFPRA